MWAEIKKIVELCIDMMTWERCCNCSGETINVFPSCKLIMDSSTNFQAPPQAAYFFSSPEHEVLMVSYCGQWLSVVRRRASCVVRRASSVVRQHLMFTL